MAGHAAITGLGVTAPTGLGLLDHWTATLAGTSGIGPVTRFDASPYTCGLAGEVPGFVPEDHLPGRLLPQTDHMTRLALVASDWALADAGVDPTEWDEYSMGTVTAASSGGFEFGQRELQKLAARGPQYVSAYQSFAWFYAVNTGQVSIHHGLRGPSGVLVTDQAGGLDAVAQARRCIRRGTKLMITGGVDGSICPWGWVAQSASGRLSASDEPDRAYLPFDARAHGHVPGEGGALLVLEDDEVATRRGAAVYGVVAGYGATTDPRPGGGRPPGLRRAMEVALIDADLQPTDIDLVFADAAAIPEFDGIEAAAISGLFGPFGVPVTAPKTMTGRLYSGGAALDLATAALALRESVIPPTINVTPEDTYQLDLVIGTPRQERIRTVLVLARGHGGFNSALVLRRP